MKTKVATQSISIATRPPCTTPSLTPVPGAVKRRFAGPTRLLLLLLLLVPATARHGFAGCDGLGGTGGDCGGGGGGSGSLLVFTTNDFSATVTGVDGLILTGVVIPSSYRGLPVTSIGPSAFAGNWVTSVTIPDSVAHIGDGAFFNCASLTNITIGNGVTNIGQGAFDSCWRLAAIKVDPLNSTYSSFDGVLFNHDSTTLLQCPMGKIGSYTIPASVTRILDGAFSYCSSLTRVVIPNGLTHIGNSTFAYCASLTSVTIPTCVSHIGDAAFSSCTSLSRIYVQGNAPTLGLGVFDSTVATVYYLPGTTGWGQQFGDRPTVVWSLPTPLILNSGPSFGTRTNGFGFIISWAANRPVVVEACTNLATPNWSPIATNTLAGGSSYFSDPDWHPIRFYRVRAR